MDTFYDRRTDRLFVTDPAHPVAAGLIVACALGFVAVAVAIPFIETERWARWLGETLCIAVAVYFMHLAVRACTEVVATCDGQARTLTVVRTHPWRRTEETIGYADVVAVATRKRIVLDAVGHFIWFTSRYDLEIALADDRKITFSADSEKQSDDAVRLVGDWLAAARARG